jgi:hypothetical protein
MRVSHRQAGPTHMSENKPPPPIPQPFRFSSPEERERSPIWRAIKQAYETAYRMQDLGLLPEFSPEQIERFKQGQLRDGSPPVELMRRLQEWHQRQQDQASEPQPAEQPVEQALEPLPVEQVIERLVEQLPEQLLEQPTEQEPPEPLVEQALEPLSVEQMIERLIEQLPEQEPPVEQAFELLIEQTPVSAIALQAAGAIGVDTNPQPLAKSRKHAGGAPRKEIDGLDEVLAELVREHPKVREKMLEFHHRFIVDELQKRGVKFDQRPLTEEGRVREDLKQLFRRRLHSPQP